MQIGDLLEKVYDGDRIALARTISLVENNSPEAKEILENLKINHKVPVVGITGPPGAGKSTLVNEIISQILSDKPEYKIAVIAVDPTSPFTNGSLLGDRLRMSGHYNDPRVYIRSLATRGALGGLSTKTFQITDVLRSAGFDLILIETVGVGQSEVEIASLADTTIVVFVPESGDDIQMIKSGIIEIADMFVVNKSDREGAERLVNNLQTAMGQKSSESRPIPLFKTNAISGEGVNSLVRGIFDNFNSDNSKPNKQNILFHKAVLLAQSLLLEKTDLKSLRESMEKAASKPDFNLYRFISDRFN